MGTDLGTARRNTVLDGLTDHDLDVLLPDLTLVKLGLSNVLHEAGQPIETVYFPVIGVVSVAP